MQNVRSFISIKSELELKLPCNKDHAIVFCSGVHLVMIIVKGFTVNLTSYHPLKIGIIYKRGGCCLTGDVVGDGLGRDIALA